MHGLESSSVKKRNYSRGKKKKKSSVIIDLNKTISMLPFQGLGWINIGYVLKLLWSSRFVFLVCIESKLWWTFTTFYVHVLASVRILPRKFF